MMVCRFNTILIADEEVNVNQRFIMTVNSGEAFGYGIEHRPSCNFCKEDKAD